MKLLDYLNKRKTNKAAAAIIKQEQEYLATIYHTYNEIKNDESFISYEVFTNQFLILYNIKKDGGIWEELVEERNEYMARKDQIAFKDFYISWSINPRFSQNILVPVISHQFDSNTRVLSWSQADSAEINNLLVKYNDYLTFYLESNDRPVEIMPGIIIKYNFDLKDYNLFFSPDLLK
ncbi:MSC_0623 family F1-like ATPase-associated protein [Mycoplasma sp. 005V]|uniref:MSC_0623 family F1-like ATPase-associated protein n=1 Tax=unclassified Mycoplasma TaxID=2683645 RepID=UPI003A877897